MNLYKTIMVIGLAGACFMACGEKPEESAQPRPAGDEVVLARVNGSPVTRSEVDLAIKKMFDAQTARILEDDDRQKILESLVMSRAIAQQAEAELSAAARAQIAQKVKLYREDLLAQKYVGAHSTPAPVTEEIMRTYYENHPEQFGAEISRTYEMILSPRKLSGPARDRTVERLSGAANQSDWKAWVQQLRRQGHPLVYRRGTIDDKLDKRLIGLLDSLQVKQTSPPTFIEGSLYLARIIKEKKTPPQSFQAVRGRIRKTLAPLQVKKAIRKVGQQALQKSEVVYEN